MKSLLARNTSRTTHLESSFIVQRRGMALLAAIFPLAFLASSFLLDRTDFQTSLSAYYWTLDLERNFFVGVLCAVGVFLLLYKGYTTLEDRILDLAGLAAVGVAFFPMSENGDCGTPGFSLHGMFAVIFFACIAFICVFMSKHSLENMANQSRKAWFTRAYNFCSGVMVLSIGLATLYNFLPYSAVDVLCENSLIFWSEVLGVWAFSAFWFLKTRELDPSQSWIPFRGRKQASA